MKPITLHVQITGDRSASQRKGKGEWAVVRSGASRARSRHRTRGSAIRAATDLIIQRGGSVYVHDRNGFVSQKITASTPVSSSV